MWLLLTFSDILTVFTPLILLYLSPSASLIKAPSIFTSPVVHCYLPLYCSPFFTPQWPPFTSLVPALTSAYMLTPEHLDLGTSDERAHEIWSFWVWVTSPNVMSLALPTCLQGPWFPFLFKLSSKPLCMCATVSFSICHL